MYIIKENQMATAPLQFQSFKIFFLTYNIYRISFQYFNPANYLYVLSNVFLLCKFIPLIFFCLLGNHAYFLSLVF